MSPQRSAAVVERNIGAVDAAGFDANQRLLPSKAAILRVVYDQERVALAVGSSDIVDARDERSAFDANRA